MNQRGSTHQIRPTEAIELKLTLPARAPAAPRATAKSRATSTARRAPTALLLADKFAENNYSTAATRKLGRIGRLRFRGRFNSLAGAVPTAGLWYGASTPISGLNGHNHSPFRPHGHWATNTGSGCRDLGETGLGILATRCPRGRTHGYGRSGPVTTARA